MRKAPTRGMRTKMAIVMILAVVVGFFGLIVRLFFLQVVEGDTYQRGAISQQLWDTPLNARRGTIYDRNGKPLAQSATAYTIYISPVYIKTEEQRKLIADKLSEILNVDRDNLYEKTKKKNQYEIVKRRCETPETDEVRKFITEYKLNCVAIGADSKRYYPFENFASHLLGFTGADNQGLNGIEAYYDKYLRGIAGRSVSAKNAKGTEMPFQYETYVEAQNGMNLTLTIDEVIQHFLEKNLQRIYKENKVQQYVSGIVMDVKTGEILAMANIPDFDPNHPFEITDPVALSRIEAAEDPKKQLGIEQNTLWRNKAITDPYEPGSTFKTLTMSMALEEKVTSISDTFNCSGGLNIGGRRINCFKTTGHGHETLTQGLENSCNPVFMTLGQRIGGDTFYKYYKAFGLIEKTGIDLPGEAEGIPHTPKELQGPVELAVSSFGQTQKVTPIQLITAVAAASNGGYLVQPRVVKQITDEDGNIIQNFTKNVKRQVVSEETSKTLSKMMESVVTNGTGKNAYVRGFRVGGKTGTSQKIDKKNEQGQIDKVVSSMIAVAPMDDPQVAILILADEPGVQMRSGGTLAGPSIAEILSEILPYMGVEPVYTEEEIQNMERKAPECVGDTLGSCISKITKSDLKYKVVGDSDPGTTVIQQMPRAGVQLPRDGTVVLYTTDQIEPKMVTVPDVVGKSPYQANQILINAKLNIRLKGLTAAESGAKVYSQSIQKDEKVEEGTVVTLTLRYETAIE